MSLIGDLAGAAAAVIATKELDPDASLLTEGIAAIAGYKGVEALTEHMEKKSEEPAQAEDDSQADSQA
ncbi:hypothetical protein CEK28_18170 [Xenophilus sp. AP218F]|nr:hypothetical protein [Chromobacterium sp. ASV5]OWY37217.1 hypothetical protein CEK28_18170 [Xenophilus sp. AP218F]